MGQLVQVCAGVTGTGDCNRRAKYAVQEGLMGDVVYACGVHMPQIVKHLLRTNEGVGVFRV